MLRDLIIEVHSLIVMSNIQIEACKFGAYGFKIDALFTRFSFLFDDGRLIKID